MRKQQLTKSITVKLDQETFDYLQSEAHKQGIGPTTLARMWIIAQRRHAETVSRGEALD